MKPTEAKRSPGQIAYELWRDRADKISRPHGPFNAGSTLPEWSAMSNDVKGKWESPTPEFRARATEGVGADVFAPAAQQ